MTAAEVTGWLDRLEAAHQAATPGDWEILLDEGVWAGATAEQGFGTFVTLTDDLSPEDAAAIIAAHNALPQLVAALRGVLDRHYPHGRNIHGDEVCAAGHSVLEPWPCPEYRAVAAALGAEVTGR